MANSSMLVLPSTTTPAARSRSTTVASYGGTPALEDLRAARGRHPAGGEDVLQRQGNAGERPERLTAAAGGVDLAGSSQRPLGRRRAGRRAARRRSPRCWSRCACVTSTALSSPEAMAAARSAAVRPTIRRLAHPSSSRMRGTRKRPSCGCRSGGEDLVARQARADLVGAEAVGHRDGVARRRHQRHLLGRAGLGHPRDAGQDHVELRRQVIELLVRQREPGQSRQVGDLLAGEAHVPIVRERYLDPSRSGRAADSGRRHRRCPLERGPVGKAAGSPAP